MNNKKSGMKLAVLTMLVLAAALGLIYINDRYANKSSSDAFSRRSFTVEGEISSLNNESEFFLCTDELIVEGAGTVVRAKRINGEQAWSMNLGGRIVSITEAGNALLIQDSRDRLSLMSKQGKLLWEYALSETLWNIFADNNGYVLIEYKNPVGSRIEVLNNKGSKVGDAELPNAYVLSFASGKDKLYTISVLDVSAEKVKTRLITYSISGGMSWAKDFENTLIPYIKYHKNNQLLAASERQLYRLREDGSILDEVKLDGKVLSIASNDNITAAVIEVKGRYYCSTFNSSLKAQGKSELNLVPVGIFVNNSNYILYDKDELIIGDLTGAPTASYKSASDISIAYMYGELLYVSSGRRLQALRYK